MNVIIASLLVFASTASAQVGKDMTHARILGVEGRPVVELPKEKAKEAKKDMEMPTATELKTSAGEELVVLMNSSTTQTAMKLKENSSAKILRSKGQWSMVLDKGSALSYVHPRKKAGDFGVHAGRAGFGTRDGLFFAQVLSSENHALGCKVEGALRVSEKASGQAINLKEDDSRECLEIEVKKGKLNERVKARKSKGLYNAGEVNELKAAIKQNQLK